MKNTVKQKVKEVLADRLDIDIDKIKDDSDLVEDLGLDSFLAVELAFELRQQTGVELKTQDFQNIKTPQDIVNFINKKAAK